MKVRYSKRATTDLIAIADYIKERNPRAAEAVAQHIRISIERLGTFPFIGRSTDDADLRVLPIGRYPYIVFYEVMEGEVVVHHIRHGRRKPPTTKEIRSE